MKRGKKGPCYARGLAVRTVAAWTALLGGALLGGALLGGGCHSTPVPEATVLVVEKLGDGLIVSTPAGIDCGEGCTRHSAAFAPATAITLQATATAGATFLGFEGACAGQLCSFALRQSTVVRARFETPPRAPLPPRLEGTSPGSPSRQRDLVVRARAAPQTRVSLYLAAGCEGTPAQTALADAAGALRFEVRVPANTTTHFAAESVEDDGRRSRCVLAPFAFLHDTQAPEPPVLLGSTPASPSRTTTRPRVHGQAEPTSLARLHLQPDCSDDLGLIALVDGAGDFALTLDVGANQPTALYASAEDLLGNRSPCSGAFVFVHDDQPPLPPQLAPTDGISNQDDRPILTGDAEPASLVRLFAGRRCAGEVLGSVVAGPTGDFAASVTVPANSQTLFSGNATDAAGNVSPCSATGPTYVFDQRPPVFAGVDAAVALSASELLLTWSAADDDFSAPEQIFYEICRSQLPIEAGGCDPFLPEAATPVGATRWVIGGLPENSRHYFVVRARDHAGNVEQNRVQATARTLGAQATIALAAGAGHTCALLANGAGRCWGWNEDGQLGNGSTRTPRQRSPVAIAGLEGATLLRAGYAHSCALRSDGTVHCWGQNTHGQLGDGTTLARLAPVPVAGLVDATTLAMGANHGCALVAGGRVWCWGGNAAGQLGDGTTEARASPVEVAGVTDAVAVVAGAEHTCALVAEGGARCWGDNSAGQLGDGTVVSRPWAVPVLGVDGAITIAAGYFHTCILRADGGTACWGNNLFGQLGDGSTASRPLASPVAGTLRASSLAAGGLHTCVVDATGGVACWGWNERGQAGGADGVERVLTPTPLAGLRDATLVVAGGEHTCVLRADGRPACFGANDYGQLGDGTLVDARQSAVVQNLSGPVNGLGLVAGAQHSCSLLADGNVHCWGDNERGQCGLTAGRPAPLPTRVTGTGGAVGLSAGNFHTCALQSDGAVRCWGWNESGQLGDGTTTNRDAPTTVLAVEGALAIASGTFHSCAVVAGGSVRCWGSNGSAQLGDGTLTDRRVAVTAQALAGVTALSAGTFHTCALGLGGTVRCWGDDSFGQLGRGTVGVPSAPSLVLGLAGATAIATGASHSCALVADGTVRCWGDNTFGQLGDGTFSRRPAPRTVVDLRGAISVHAGRYHTCAVVAGSQVRCWGWNVNGQLGDGSFSDRTRPTRVAGLELVRALAPGQSHTCALLDDGTVRCWGVNESGQLADGTHVDQTHPRHVRSFP